MPTWITNNASAIIIGLVIGLITALIAGYIVFVVTKREVDVVYSSRVTTLIRNSVASLPGLQILYKGHAVSELTVTRVVVFNRGRGTLRAADIAEPLSIVCHDIKVLNAVLVTRNNDASQMGVEHDGAHNKINIGLNYLDHKDGGVVELLTSWPKGGKMRFTGTIMGQGKPRKVQVTEGGLLNSAAPTLTPVFLAGFVASQFDQWAHRGFSAISGIILVVTAISALVGSVLWVTVFRPTIAIPSTLTAFFKDEYHVDPSLTSAAPAGD